MGATDIQWVVAGVRVNCLQCTREPLPTKKRPTPNVSAVESEKLCLCRKECSIPCAGRRLHISRNSLSHVLVTRALCTLKGSCYTSTKSFF